MIEGKNLDLGYPSRWVAIKLLENDPEVRKLVEGQSMEVVNYAYDMAREIEGIHSEPSFSVIASERYFLANQFAYGAQLESKIKITFSEKLDRLVTHRIFGYIISALVIGGLLLWTFLVGTSYPIYFHKLSVSSNLLTRKLRELYRPYYGTEHLEA